MVCSPHHAFIYKDFIFTLSTPQRHSSLLLPARQARTLFYRQLKFVVASNSATTPALPQPHHTLFDNSLLNQKVPGSITLGAH
jgi:hypothetical protein